MNEKLKRRIQVWLWARGDAKLKDENAKLRRRIEDLEAVEAALEEMLERYKEMLEKYKKALPFHNAQGSFERRRM